jgi:hypothetical protein
LEIASIRYDTYTELQETFLKDLMFGINLCLSHKLGPSFNPTASLLVSSVRLLAPKSCYISKGREIDDFWSSLASALFYAHRAKAETQEPRLTLHDQLGAFLSQTVGRSAKFALRWANKGYRSRHFDIKEGSEVNSIEEESSGIDYYGEEELEEEEEEEDEEEDDDNDEREEESNESSRVEQDDESEVCNEETHSTALDNLILIDRYSPLPWTVVSDLAAYVSANESTTLVTALLDSGAGVSVC